MQISFFKTIVYRISKSFIIITCVSGVLGLHLIIHLKFGIVRNKRG